MFSTIGYERTSLSEFIQTLREAEVELLVDIRDRAQSRRKGFSKTALSEALKEAGINYLHLRTLGDPKEGREAARAGDYDKFKEIFGAVIQSKPAKTALSEVSELARESHVCLMCYEKDHRFCHRSIVSDKLTDILGCDVKHLEVESNDRENSSKRRVLHTCQSASAQI